MRCAILAPFYGWFAEGFDALDLKAAQAAWVAHNGVEICRE